MLSILSTVGRNTLRRMLASFAHHRHLIITAAPLTRIHPLTHVAMKRRIRPIRHSLHMPVLDGIVMGIINVRGIVAFIAQRVLPKAPLPKPRSPRATRTDERRSLLGKRLENAALIKRQRSV
jgi:hypothetical protein